MFWRRELLDAAVDQLTADGYHVVTLDAAGWRAAPDMLGAVGSALDFPDHYGRNLDALNDCLRDVAAGDYGWPAGSSGLVLVLLDFDRFVEIDRPSAHALLDIWADQARSAALAGNTLRCLVQTDDPRLRS